MTTQTLSNLAHERDLLKAALKDTVERADISLRAVIEQRDSLKAINVELLKTAKNLMAELDARWPSNNLANCKDELRDAIAKADTEKRPYCIAHGSTSF